LSSAARRVVSNDAPTYQSYTRSLHDALPISPGVLVMPEHQQRGLLHREVVVVAHLGLAIVQRPLLQRAVGEKEVGVGMPRRLQIDRKSTRLNFSHVKISYAVFCLKKKKTNKK